MFDALGDAYASHWLSRDHARSVGWSAAFSSTSVSLPLSSSSTHRRRRLSVCAMRLPSGDGTASQRTVSPPELLRSGAPTPLAGSMVTSSSPDSSEIAASLAPSGMNAASR